MPTKTIADKTRQADTLARGALHFAPQVAEGLRHALGCDLDWETTQRRLGEELLEAAAVLRAADEACSRERHAAVRLRSRRDEASRALYRHLVSLRRVLAATYGEPVAFSLLGLAGKTPRKADVLALAGRDIVERLRELSLALPETPSLGFPLDRDRLAAELDAKVAPLERLLKAVEASRVGLIGLLAERDREQERFRDVRTGLARVLEGLYVAAGMPELVPGLRRPGAAVLRPVRERLSRRKTRPHQVSGRLAEAPAARPAAAAETPVAPATPPPAPGETAVSPTPLHLVPATATPPATPRPRATGRPPADATPRPGGEDDSRPSETARVAVAG